ncbi:MAG: hypothetical protein J1E16_04420 [Muribaculaceae bacterium]|nr:hypothetical protein [Muribaculaceae bacterium]
MEEEFFEDLLMAGQEVLERNPEIGFEKWTEILMRHYPTEIIDALGPTPERIHSSLEEIWKTHFKSSPTALKFKAE